MCKEKRFFPRKSLHETIRRMYQKQNRKQPYLDNFHLPFGGKLRSDNRWVTLARMIPWELAETFYAGNFASSKRGAPAMSARIALGALIIKERLGLSDEEAVEQIRENPYLQYFLGFERFRDEAPFDPSMYVYFRKRFTLDQLAGINESIVLAERQKKEAQATKERKSNDDNTGGGTNPSDLPRGNKGKLIIDATCAPADIRHPTDIGLLNEAREKTEEIIDIMFAPLKGAHRKPRTYRLKARRQQLEICKRKKLSKSEIRKAVGRQLRFLGRNLKTIAALCDQGSLTLLSRRQYRDLLVIHELYRQQHWMHENRCHRVSDRIVSISQPHVRPIVRGKASAPTEFGAKLSASLVDGAVLLDRLDWNAFNEGGDLVDQVEAYRRRFGHYPESLHCDKIYRTRENRAFCHEHGIRISGPSLGRPMKKTQENAANLRNVRRQQRQDEIDRIPIEGKFGQGKRRFGLGRIMAKLSQTSETVMGIIFIVMNLEKWLKNLFFVLVFRLRQVSNLFRKGLYGIIEPYAGIFRSDVSALHVVKEHGGALLAAP